MPRSPQSTRRPSSDDDSTASRPRLQRLLAMAGAGSRRHCEEFILTGRVTVDGQTVRELGTRVDPDLQEVRLDGERLHLQRKVYYLLNKPPGYLCTNRDPDGRPRVVDLFPKDRERLFTVGRLDEESQGLIVVTNDGELANQLAHPKFRIRKTYHVQVAGVPTREMIGQLTQGLYFAEGRFKATEARLIKVHKLSALIEIVLTEGQNREIRRLLAKLGHKVQRLQRVALGTLELGEVPPGHYRPLTQQEVWDLRGLANPQGGQTKKKPPRPAGQGAPAKRQRSQGRSSPPPSQRVGPTRGRKR
ncbi:MAG: pseudouridine synthase [Planctomycetales bacterium]